MIISYCLKRRMFYRSGSFIGRCFTDLSMEIAQMEAGYIELLVQLVIIVGCQLVVGYKLSDSDLKMVDYQP
jgi:hypothetical protein